MRIAFVTLGFAPARMSGLDISGERLVHDLLEAGHHVTVIAGAYGQISETVSHASLKIQRAPLGHSNWIGFAFRSAQLLKKLENTRPFDIVHFWDLHFAYAYAGRYIATLHQSFRQRSKALKFTNAGLPSQLYNSTYYLFARILAENRSARRAHGLMSVSATTRDEFIRNYGIPTEKIALTRHGIDTRFFHRMHATDFLRSQLKLNPGEPILFFAGFVTPRKGLDYLAQALPSVQPAPKLIIAGNWRREYRSHFLSMLGPAAYQVIEAGFIPDAQMPAYYSLADVYVSPSLLEGFGLPLAESLACETPVVAADAGATAEVIGPGGLLVPPADPAALAQAVSSLLGDQDRRRGMGIRGREHIEREFGSALMLENLLQAYERFR